MILAGLRELARTLGCAEHQAETVVREERSARAALSRRGLFKAAGAVAAGTLASLPAPELPGFWVVNPSLSLYGIDVRLFVVAYHVLEQVSVSLGYNQPSAP